MNFTRKLWVNRALTFAEALQELNPIALNPESSSSLSDSIRYEERSTMRRIAKKYSNLEMVINNAIQNDDFLQGRASLTIWRGEMEKIFLTLEIPHMLSSINNVHNEYMGKLVKAYDLNPIVRKDMFLRFPEALRKMLEERPVEWELKLMSKVGELNAEIDSN